jgi:hypothetical protein
MIHLPVRGLPENQNRRECTPFHHWQLPLPQWAWDSTGKAAALPRTAAGQAIAWEDWDSYVSSHIPPNFFVNHYSCVQNREN